jgi:hypothetical protein
MLKVTIIKFEPIVLSGSVALQQTIFQEYRWPDALGVIWHIKSRSFSVATSILHSQNIRFQIPIYLIGNWDFF